MAGAGRPKKTVATMSAHHSHRAGIAVAVLSELFIYASTSLLAG
jgi:hypothetical protein